jgi:hypothetical protein
MVEKYYVQVYSDSKLTISVTEKLAINNGCYMIIGAYDNHYDQCIESTHCVITVRKKECRIVNTSTFGIFCMLSSTLYIPYFIHFLVGNIVMLPIKNQDKTYTLIGYNSTYEAVYIESLIPINSVLNIGQNNPSWGLLGSNYNGKLEIRFNSDGYQLNEVSKDDDSNGVWVSFASGVVNNLKIRVGLNTYLDIYPNLQVTNFPFAPNYDPSYKRITDILNGLSEYTSFKKESIAEDFKLSADDLLKINSFSLKEKHIAVAKLLTKNSYLETDALLTQSLNISDTDVYELYRMHDDIVMCKILFQHSRRDVMLAAQQLYNIEMLQSKSV